MNPLTVRFVVRGSPPDETDPAHDGLATPASPFGWLSSPRPL